MKRGNVPGPAAGKKLPFVHNLPLVFPGRKAYDIVNALEKELRLFFNWRSAFAFPATRGQPPWRRFVEKNPWDSFQPRRL